MSSDKTNTNTNNGSTPARRRPQRQAARNSPYGGSRPTTTTTTTTTPGTNPTAPTHQQLVAQLRRTEAAVDGGSGAGTGAGATAPALAPGATSAGRRGERVQAGQNLGRDLDEYYERLAVENIRGFANALAGFQDLDRNSEALEDLVRRVEARRFEAGADEDPFVVDADGRVVGTSASAALAPGTASAGRRGGSAVATGLDNGLGSGSGSATRLVPLDELHAQLDRAASVGYRRGGSTAADDEDPFVVDEDGRVVATTASAEVPANGGVMSRAGRRDDGATGVELLRQTGRRVQQSAASVGHRSEAIERLRHLGRRSQALWASGAAAADEDPFVVDEGGRVVGTSASAALAPGAASSGRRGGSAAAGANGTFLFGAEERRRDAEIDAFLAHGRQVNDVMAADTRRIVEENRQGVAANAEVLGAHGVAIAELQQGQEEIREEMDEIRQEQQEIRRRHPPKKGKGGKRGGKK